MSNTYQTTHIFGKFGRFQAQPNLITSASTWLHAMHSTAIAGVLTCLSWVRKKAGPRNPIDCMICNIMDLEKTYLQKRKTGENQHLNHIFSISPCLTNCCYRITSADKGICNPTPYICKNSHGQPWQDTEEPGFSKVELQNLKKQSRINENSNFDRLSWTIVPNL